MLELTVTTGMELQIGDDVKIISKAATRRDVCGSVWTRLKKKELKE